MARTSTSTSDSPAQTSDSPAKQRKTPAGPEHFHRFLSACSRGFRVRSPWWVVFGLIVAIVAAYLYFSQRTQDPVEGGFPNYMQNVEE